MNVCENCQASLQIGKMVPDFTLESYTQGIFKKISLSDYRVSGCFSSFIRSTSLLFVQQKF